MGKKNKPIDDGFNTIDPIKPATLVEANVSETETIFEGKIASNAIANNLEKYEDLQQQNLALLKEKDELVERLGNYITELNQLKEISANSTQGNGSSISSESSLQIQIEQLQKLNDEYLSRISQLTFENASLKSQVSELSKTSNENEAIQQKCQLQSVKQQIPQRNYNQSTSTFNGYSSWN